MNDFKSYERRRTSRIPFSCCIYSDVNNRVSTFYKRRLLLQRRHVSVKFTAASLIRRAMISPGIFK